MGSDISDPCPESLLESLSLGSEISALYILHVNFLTLSGKPELGVDPCPVNLSLRSEISDPCLVRLSLRSDPCLEPELGVRHF